MKYKIYNNYVLIDRSIGKYTDRNSYHLMLFGLKKSPYRAPNISFIESVIKSGIMLKS